MVPPEVTTPTSPESSSPKEIFTSTSPAPIKSPRPLKPPQINNFHFVTGEDMLQQESRFDPQPCFVDYTPLMSNGGCPCEVMHPNAVYPTQMMDECEPEPPRDVPRPTFYYFEPEPQCALHGAPMLPIPPPPVYQQPCEDTFLWYTGSYCWNVLFNSSRANKDSIKITFLSRLDCFWVQFLFWWSFGVTIR